MKAWVIMSNDYPETVALSKEAADQEVIRLKTKHGEPLEGRAQFKVRYIRAVEVTVVAS